MSGSCLLNGVRVTHARITLPLVGAWTADVELEGSAVVNTAVTLTIGGLSLVGTVTKQDVFAGVRKCRIVAGAAGWRTTIPARGYSNPVGVALSTVVTDAARESGETAVVGTDRNIGNFYARDSGRAKRVLSLLAGNVWYVDSLGVTQVAARPSSAIVSPFTVNKWNPNTGIFEISTETYQDWIPNRTFTSNTVPAVQTISSVAIEADNEGKVRLTVTTTKTNNEKLLHDLRSIIRDEIANLSYCAEYEYNISASSNVLGIGYTIDATPSVSSMPSLTRMPLAPGLGLVVPALAGTKCRVRFLNGDPTKPEVVSVGSTTEHLLTVEAFSVLMHNMIFAMGSAGLPPAWLASGVIPGIINLAFSGAAAGGGAGLIAQTAAAASMASSMTSGPGSSSTLYTAAIAALSAKLPDVTGLFPGVGVPNG